MSKRTHILYLQDIQDSIQAIFSYTADMMLDDFVIDRKTYSAAIREFEIIGEAVGKLPDELKASYPDIYWQDIKDFRNLLIHEYFGVDLEILWNVIQQDLPKLRNAIEAALAK